MYTLGIFFLILQKVFMKERITWIDVAKGFGIFLVVYGHNFPVTETYIYTFHMPLFFMIAGFFHPEKLNARNIKKRFKSLVVPYFLWAFILYLFWLFAGRKFGVSATQNLSIEKNFIGIFYGQGGMQYMDWGIPMWFLLAIFNTFLLFGLVKMIRHKILQVIVLLLLILLGFLLPEIYPVHYVWSFDVALVSLVFYAFGYYVFPYLKALNKRELIILVIILALLHFGLFRYNSKVDMYRSQYGNIFWFIFNGITGSVFYLLLFKLLKNVPFLNYLGKNTIPILAMQLRAMTVIKVFLVFVLGYTVLEFNETEKFFYAIVQIILILPVIYIINKYLPVLNGKSKKI